MKNQTQGTRCARFVAARRGFGLVELLVVAVILILLIGGTAYYVNGGGKTQTTANGTRKVTPKSRAYDVDCQSNLRQDRMAIGMAHDSDADGKFPATLNDVPGTAGIRKCPDGGEPYTYDPQTGEVHCPHPGHEKL